MNELFIAIFRRELTLALRRPTEALLPLGFFAVAASVFPLGVGPEPQTLRTIAPGIVWVCALLAAMLSVTRLYAVDHADGSLAQLLLAGHDAWVVVAAKTAAHWTRSGLPLVLCAPLFGLLFDVAPPVLGALAVGLLLGTPSLSLLGSLGAALTIGLREANVLVVLLVLPLAVPLLVFGSGAAIAADGGQSAFGHLALLGALLIGTALVATPAAAVALRVSVE